MITIQLTKLESSFEQVRKSYPKLSPSDAALVATALVRTGRQAIAVYEGDHYSWPNDNEKLIQALTVEIKDLNSKIEPVKKSAKNHVEEEPIQASVGLIANYEAGESVLKTRNDLKTLLSDILKDGVEYSYTASDIGWQWALDRTNWKTAGSNEFSRRIRIKTAFTEGAVGVEIGLTPPKKKGRTAKVAEIDLEPLPEEPLDNIEIND